MTLFITADGSLSPGALCIHLTTTAHGVQAKLIEPTIPGFVPCLRNPTRTTEGWIGTVYHEDIAVWDVTLGEYREFINMWQSTHDAINLMRDIHTRCYHTSVHSLFKDRIQPQHFLIRDDHGP